MKLSEAIILGSTMYKQAFGTLREWNSMGPGLPFEQARCAWGGAYGAAGIELPDLGSGQIVPAEWRWTLSLTVICPVCPTFPSVSGNIAHLNDVHQWPAAKIGAWVRSIEPQDFIQDLTQSIKQNAEKFTECECCEALAEKAKGYWTEGHFYCELCSPAIREQEIRIGNEQSDYQHGLGVKA